MVRKTNNDAEIKKSASKTDEVKKSVSKSKVNAEKKSTDEKVVTNASVSNNTVVKAKRSAANRKSIGKTAIEPKNEKVSSVDVSNAVLNKENTDPMAAVMAVKEKNETKKSNKAKAAVAKKEAVAEKKGVKSENSRQKRAEVKEKAQKAEASKFMNKKAETKSDDGNTCQKCNGCQTLKAFVDGYVNIFNYSGRTSRFEFWGFGFVNMLLAIIVGAISFPLLIDVEPTVGVGIASSVLLFVIALIILLAGLSITVRRLHDVGFKGWKGFFAPLTYTFIVLCGLFGWAQYEIFSIMKSGGFDLSNDLLIAMQYAIMTANKTAFGIGFICFVIALLIHIYYLFKTFIVVGFFEGDSNSNEYGEPKFNNECYRNITIRYIAIYFTISTILNILSQALSIVGMLMY